MLWRKTRPRHDLAAAATMTTPITDDTIELTNTRLPPRARCAGCTEPLRPGDWPILGAIRRHVKPGDGRGVRRTDSAIASGAEAPKPIGADGDQRLESNFGQPGERDEQPTTFASTSPHLALRRPLAAPKARPVKWTTNASEGDRSAETANGRVWRRSVEKQPDSARTSGLTVTGPVDHKPPFSAELIYDRARTTTGVDQQRPPAFDSA